MNEQEHIHPEVENLLQTLADHAANQRRQQALSDMIDQLEAEEQHSRPKVIPLRRWLGAATVAAACIAAWVWIQPNPSSDPVPTSPTATFSPRYTAAAEEVPVMQKTAQRLRKHWQPHTPVAIPISDNPIVTDSIVEIAIETTVPQEIAIVETAQEIAKQTKPTRRVIQSENLVCESNCPMMEYGTQNQIKPDEQFALVGRRNNQPIHITSF